MEDPIVFFIRNKPQDADIIDLVLEEKRVFIGYPPYKKDSKYDETSIKSCMYDISKLQFIDSTKIEKPEFSRNITKNINLVKDAVRDSYVIIPRPERGIYYVGKIIEFELVDNPSWKNKYKKLRECQKLKWKQDNAGSKYHVGDIVQSWKVEKFKKISPYEFPAWVRYSLFGRSTIGRVKDLDAKNKVYPIIEELYEKGKISSPDDLKSKLLYFLSPETFEHFMSNLLTLEHKSKNQVWIHIGGSGDGGVDCICFDKSSKEVKGIAQCKLKKQSIKEAKEILSNLNKKMEGENYVCNFYLAEDIPECEDKRILNQKRILDLFEKHEESNYWEIIR